jgi:beta-lactamase class A
MRTYSPTTPSAYVARTPPTPRTPRRSRASRTGRRAARRGLPLGRLLLFAGIVALIWWRGSALPFLHGQRAAAPAGAPGAALIGGGSAAVTSGGAVPGGGTRGIDPAAVWVAGKPDPQLAALVERLVDDDNGDTAVVVRNLRTGASAGYHERDVFPSASLAKVPILVETYRRLASGALHDTDFVPITSDAITDGAGVLQARTGEEISIAELVHLSISVSDNVAARLLMRQVGGVDAINRTMAEMGLTQTRLYADERPNVTSAEEMASLLAWAAAQGWSPAGGVAVSPAASAPEYLPLAHTLPWLLAQPQAQAWITQGLPQGTVVAHKSGQLPGVRNEAAVVYTPKGPFVVVGLTDHLADQDSAEAFLARLARDVYRYFSR